MITHIDYFPGDCSSLPNPSPILLSPLSTSPTDFSTALRPLYFNNGDSEGGAEWGAIDERPERVVFVRRRLPREEEEAINLQEDDSNSSSVDEEGRKFKVKGKVAECCYSNPFFFSIFSINIALANDLYSNSS